MFRGRYFRNLADSEAQINMAPLIDMIFILLIFFLVTTTFVSETGIEVRRPRAASAGRLERESIYVAVSPSGTVYLENREIGLLALRARVRELLRRRQRPVVVIPDARTPAQALIDVIDECKLAGAENVSLAARREE